VFRPLRSVAARLVPRGLTATQWLLAVAGVASVAALMVVADATRRRADEYRRAEVALEQIRAEAANVSAIAWQGLFRYYTEGASAPLGSALSAAGVSTWSRIQAALDELRSTGTHRALAVLSRDHSDLFNAGMDAYGAFQRGDAARAVRLARTRIQPAIERLEANAAALARGQRATARSTLTRARLILLLSVLLAGVLVGTLAWRFERTRRRMRIAQELRAAERAEEERLRALLEQSRDCLLVLGDQLVVRWAGGAAQSLFGRDACALVGVPFDALVVDEDRALVANFLAAAAARTNGDGIDCRLRHESGYTVHAEIVASDRSTDPKIGGIVLTVRDIGERKQFEQELRHRAFHDSLTGLPNRALFEDRVGQALARVRSGGGRAAVILVDLDDFKSVNDGLGHGVGDELLRAAGRRIAACAKPADTVARFGGDEFALLCSLGQGEDPLTVASRVLAALRDPFNVDGRELRLSASIGVVDLDAGATVAETLRDADTAMYAAKEGGKDRVELFDPDMHRRALARLELRGELARALEHDQLLVHYQPIVDLESGRIAGLEALLRWHHPERGLVPPLEFIPIAEESGLIIPIGLWVLRRALADVAGWRARIQGCAIDVSVNVSPRQLREPGFAQDVENVLRDTGIDPGAVVLEITESLLAEDSDALAARLERLRALGVRIAVDDFGTGYSALSRLRSLPIDILKIDRSFIRDIDRDHEKEALVRGILSLGQTLRLEVVAEGIEDEEQVRRLRAMASTYGQGFHFSKPLPAAEIERVLATTANVARVA